ncbi:uncharacterized protein LOC106174696 [Lingula anatina]|uniref:Uncharacterized protein LOC106174696 n=1 Tax=Lingula anatina TaxID=7574 RepID=A0A1S3JNU3_LINAN|nr:uncharacterized protein LOC106174696 [Lingula anatina]|eukprot:XP_013411811.1 uncharacterized protein LOC106174696 [Lingula anatina]
MSRPSVYAQVVEVISKPTSERKDFEIAPLLPWFKKKSELFKDLKSDILHDVIKHCSFVKNRQNQLIIRQGDKGECFFILLSGRVSIYIFYAKNMDSSENESTEHESDVTDDEYIVRDRRKLGTYVTTLNPGATFGEVALVSEDCVRTASIICDDPCDMIVIDRDLYTRSVKSVLAQEFEDKAKFVSTNQFFGGWPPKYKKQLAMALEKHTLTYDSVLAKQGQPVNALYFILRGEVKLSMDPQLHSSMFPSSPTKVRAERKKEDANGTQTKGAPISRKLSRAVLQKKANPHKKKVEPRKLIDVCCLGPNECIGDIEVLLEYETFLQTAKCTQKTEILTLDMRHWDRLFVKRQPKTIEKMRQGLELRIQCRITDVVEKHIPFMKQLLSKSKQYNIIIENTENSKTLSKMNPTKKDDAVDIVPPWGPLIDQYAPGTVFHRIRAREHRRKLRQLRDEHRKSLEHPTSADELIDFNDDSAVRLPKHLQRLISKRHPQPNGISRTEEIQNDVHGLIVTSTDASHANLDDLENKIQNWLGPGSRLRDKNRVARLRRIDLEAMERKPVPGVRVFVKPRRAQSASDQSRDGSIGTPPDDYSD